MNSGQESISTIIDSLNSLSDNPTNTDLIKSQIRKRVLLMIL